MRAVPVGRLINSSRPTFPFSRLINTPSVLRWFPDMRLLARPYSVLRNAVGRAGGLVDGDINPNAISCVLVRCRRCSQQVSVRSRHCPTMDDQQDYDPQDLDGQQDSSRTSLWLDCDPGMLLLSCARFSFSLLTSIGRS
jgi:hypothetical protein